MKRPAKPGEGEIPAGLSEVPGGGPQAFTDPETGERMIKVEFEVTSDKRLMETPVKAPKPTAKRSRSAKD